MLISKYKTEKTKNPELYIKPTQRKRKRKTAERRLREFKTLSLDDKLNIIRQYNDKHGTNISYGKFIAGVENGSIKV